jgi:hypothetical protein
MTAPGAGLVRLLRIQQELWDHFLWGPHASGAEARSLLGEPPLRWSGARLRGSVLPDQPGQRPTR